MTDERENDGRNWRRKIDAYSFQFPSLSLQSRESTLSSKEKGWIDARFSGKHFLENISEEIRFIRIRYIRYPFRLRVYSVTETANERCSEALRVTDISPTVENFHLEAVSVVRKNQEQGKWWIC